MCLNPSVSLNNENLRGKIGRIVENFGSTERELLGFELSASENIVTIEFDDMLNENRFQNAF